VDDDYFFVDLVEDILGEESEVIYASNGTMALEVASQSLPDIILLDVMMPEIHGYEVCRRLKAHHETTSIPVIFLTSLGQASSQEIGLKLGASDYVTKPFDPEALRVQIHRRIERKCAMDKHPGWRRCGTILLNFMRLWRPGPLL
jgi:putative two-component system response regulator